MSRYYIPPDYEVDSPRSDRHQRVEPQIGFLGQLTLLLVSVVTVLILISICGELGWYCSIAYSREERDYLREVGRWLGRGVGIGLSGLVLGSLLAFVMRRPGTFSFIAQFGFYLGLAAAAAGAASVFAGAIEAEQTFFFAFIIIMVLSVLWTLRH